MSYEPDLDNEADFGTTAAYGDMITATLFVFILVLIAYVINFTDNRDREKTLGEQVSEIVMRQSFIVDQVSRRLSVSGIDHEADKKHGVIRISSDDLAFEAGSYELRPNQGSKVDAVAAALAGVIPCYGSPSLAVFQRLGCGAKQHGQLRAVAVEGHTDNVPLSPGKAVRDNMDLSALRAATVLGKIKANPVLANLANGNGRQMFFSSGYGSTRPINDHATPVSDRENRRIEIRLVLDNPWTF